MEKESYNDIAVQVQRLAARKICSSDFKHYIDEVKLGMKHRPSDERLGFLT